MATREEQQNTLVSNFSLLDVLISEAVLRNLEIANISQEKLSDYTKHLEELFRYQLESFYAEDKGLPIHSMAAEISLKDFYKGNLRIFGRYYNNKNILTNTTFDLLDQAQKAIDVQPIGVKRNRYQKEKDQLEILYKHLHNELKNWLQDKKGFLQSNAQHLSSEIRQQEGLSDNQEIWLGQQYTAALPINKEVYPDEKGFQNIFQLVFIPNQNRMILITEQLFAPFTLSDQSKMFSVLAGKKIRSTEESLMEIVEQLPQELRGIPGWKHFLQAGEKVFTGKKKKDVVFQMLAKQQKLKGELHERKEDIQFSASFLTQVLLMNYWLCAYNPSAVSELPERLQSAFVIVANSLISGQPFRQEQYTAALGHYHEQWRIFKDYLSNESGFTKKMNQQNFWGQINNNVSDLQKRVNRNDYLQQNRTKEVSYAVAIKHNNMVLGAMNHLPSLGQRIVSGVSCAAGSYGGLINQMNVVADISSISNLSNLNPASLGRLIGEERAKLWKKGKCVNPNCHSPMKGQEQMVGECSLCLACEMYFTNQGQTLYKDNTLPNPSRFLNKKFYNPLDVLSNFLDLTINVNDLMPSLFMPDSFTFRMPGDERTVATR